MRCAWIWMMAIVIFDVVHSADQEGGSANNGWGRIRLVTGALPAGVDGSEPAGSVPRLNLLAVQPAQGPDAPRGEAESTRTSPGTARVASPTPPDGGSTADAAGNGSTQ